MIAGGVPDPVREFRGAMAAAGIVTRTPIIPDGRLHRFHVEGDRGRDRNGWYKLHVDDPPAGAFGCWKRGISGTWSAKADSSLTPAERAEWREKVERARRARKAEERSQRERAARRAERIWAAADRARPDYPYLKAKGVRPYGLRQSRDRLLVPVRDQDGKLHGLQYISADGTKRFLTGSATAGNYHSIGRPGGTIAICEGYATAATVHEATGFAAVAAYSAGNLLRVAEKIRAKFPEARIIIAADNDRDKGSNTGVIAATEAASAVGGVVAVPRFGDGERGTDWNDYAALHGLGAVASVLEDSLRIVRNTQAAEQQEREADISLVADVADLAGYGEEKDSGARMLDQVHEFVGRFVSYPNAHARVAHTLWIAHAHMMEAWESTPRLAFLSPEPGSGKTRALETTELLVPNPVEAVNVTPAYLFRKVGDPAGMPTILFDEIDTVFGPKAKDNEEIRGLLNAGHRRGAVAGRCVVRGKIVETEEIPAYCAVALAGLGGLPDTILSRAVVVRMRRRAPDEQVEPFRRRIHGAEGHQLRDELAAWAAAAVAARGTEWPEMPEGIQDRDADVWEPLLAVAESAGGEWLERARAAAVALVKSGKEETASLGVRLLTDLKAVFGDREHMTTEDILSALIRIDEAPWGDLKGKPLNDRGLAQRLREYQIKSKVIRVGDKTPRGYKRADLLDAWTRYLPNASHNAELDTGHGEGGGMHPSLPNSSTSATAAAGLENSSKTPSTPSATSATPGVQPITGRGKYASPRPALDYMEGDDAAA